MKKLLKFTITNCNIQNSFGISIVVGTILVLINQYQIIFLKETIDMIFVLQVFLTYLVPFLVATYSGYLNKKL